MDAIEFSHGATPSKRMGLEEFVRDKIKKLDDNHTTLFLKREQMKKDIANLEEQILMLEGAVTFVNKFLSEWALYDNDTQRLRALEEASRAKVAQTAVPVEPLVVPTVKPRKPRTLKGNAKCQEQQ